MAKIILLVICTVIALVFHYEVSAEKCDKTKYNCELMRM